MFCDKKKITYASLKEIKIFRNRFVGKKRLKVCICDYDFTDIKITISIYGRTYNNISIFDLTILRKCTTHMDGIRKKKEQRRFIMF